MLVKVNVKSGKLELLIQSNGKEESLDNSTKLTKHVGDKVWRRSTTFTHTTNQVALHLREIIVNVKNEPKPFKKVARCLVDIQMGFGG
jgi:hypothetical protein